MAVNYRFRKKVRKCHGVRVTKSKFFLFYLSILSMLGFLATDMYLPAFSAMQEDFNTSASTISASLSIFLAGFACAQLLWGTLSDRFGPKRVLCIGLSLFALGCIGMLWVANEKYMLALRFLQAIGVCSATVSWQVLVIERYSKTQANRVFATIMPLVALSPALAPLLGAWLLNHFSWRAIFFVLFIITLMLLVYTTLLRSQDEKIVTEKSKTPKISTQKSGNKKLFQLLLSPGYSGNVLIYSTCSAAFFAWLTGSPFILKDLGLGPTDIGLSYIPQTIAFLLGGYGYRAALNYVKGKRFLLGLLALYSLSVISLFLIAISGRASLLALLIPFCGMAMANGAIYPIVVAKALRVFPEDAGKAAALQNTLQLCLCFLASLAVSAWISDPLRSTATVMLLTMFPAFIGYILQRDATTSPARPTSTDAKEL